MINIQYYYFLESDESDRLWQVLNKGGTMKKLTIMTLGFLFSNLSFAVQLNDKQVTTPDGALVSAKTTESGMTVYTFDPDQGQTTSVCNAACAEKWPPILLTSQEASELKDINLGTVKRTTGLIQLTFKGQPLYFYFADRISGEAKGDGVGDVWHVVLP